MNDHTPRFAGLALIACSLVSLATVAPAQGTRREAAVHRTSFADGLRAERIPADARFVLHFDLEAFKRTTLWTLVQAHEEDIHDDMEGLEEFEEEFGIDPLTDVRSVTVYGTRADTEPGAVQIVVSDRIEGALRSLKEREGYRALDHEGYLIHSFGDDHEVVYAYVRELSGGDRLLVVSKELENVHHAALVLDGKEESLAGAGTLHLAPKDGSFLYLAASGVPGVEKFRPASQVFGLAQGIQFDLGEAGGSLFAHLAMSTESPDSAMDIADTVQGLMALARIAMREENGIPVEARELMRALEIDTRGNEVTIDFRYETQGLFRILESLDENEHEPEEHR